MSSKHIVLPNLIGYDKIQLGSLVSDPLNAHIGAYKPVLGEMPLTTSFNSVKGLLSNAWNKRLNVSLTTLLSTSINPGREVNVDLQTRLVKRYDLEDPFKVFDAVCSSPEAHKWLQTAFRHGLPAYFIAGAVTVTDPKISHKASRSRSYGGDLQIPVAAALAGGVDPTGGLLNPGIGAEWNDKRSQEMSYEAEGEMVWALNALKLRFPFFQPKRLDKAVLKDQHDWWTVPDSWCQASCELDKIDFSHFSAPEIELKSPPPNTSLLPLDSEFDQDLYHGNIISERSNQQGKDFADIWEFHATLDDNLGLGQDVELIRFLKGARVMILQHG